MQHFPIVKSLARVALAHGSAPVRQQVERLASALRSEGEVQDAAALERLLHSDGRAAMLAPSRLTRSTLASREVLTSAARVPVDKETSAPLATVVMAEDNGARLPLFPTWMQTHLDVVVAEWRQHDRLLEAGLDAAQSLLVHGPPGTGKTTVALWLARELQLPAVVVRLDGLISSFLGSTARNVGALFAFANRFECVLVLDEFDAIAKLRDDPNEVGEIKRVVNALLQNIDERSGQGVTVGLTNHAALLDPAIWRRFEVQLEVPLPGPEQRAAIALRSLDADGAVDVEAKLLGALTDGMSGAEVQSVAIKYRKRRLLDPRPLSAPAITALQVVATSRNRSASTPVPSVDDEAELTRWLAVASPGFSHGELATIFGRSTKTIGRRVADVGGGAVDA